MGPDVVSQTRLGALLGQYCALLGLRFSFMGAILRLSWDTNVGQLGGIFSDRGQCPEPDRTWGPLGATVLLVETATFQSLETEEPKNTCEVYGNLENSHRHSPEESNIGQ